mmetsp:Transcript_49117/g.151676  ORF Transcript_49117/g.151676 Transcript_49117/m.151676 type:complete len:233 (-) Transcript_49117:1960-2658(-)
MPPASVSTHDRAVICPPRGAGAPCGGQTFVSPPATPGFLRAVPAAFSAPAVRQADGKVVAGCPASWAGRWTHAPVARPPAACHAARRSPYARGSSGSGRASGARRRSRSRGRRALIAAPSRNSPLRRTGRGQAPPGTPACAQRGCCRHRPHTNRICSERPRALPTHSAKVDEHHFSRLRTVLLVGVTEWRLLGGARHHLVRSRRLLPLAPQPWAWASPSSHSSFSAPASIEA